MSFGAMLAVVVGAVAIVAVCGGFDDLGAVEYVVVSAVGVAVVLFFGFMYTLTWRVKPTYGTGIVYDDTVTYDLDAPKGAEAV